jgi:hypothetical protein
VRTTGELGTPLYGLENRAGHRASDEEVDKQRCCLKVLAIFADGQILAHLDDVRFFAACGKRRGTEFVGHGWLVARQLVAPDQANCRFTSHQGGVICSGFAVGGGGVGIGDQSLGTHIRPHLDAVELLFYRSNLLGSDQSITNTGGGNTSSKIKMNDPLSGEELDILWVKGSGGDLRAPTRANFASLYMDKFLSLENIYAKADIRGAKTEIEDAMVDMYRHTIYCLNPAASSIDTPLHGLIPLRGPHAFCIRDRHRCQQRPGTPYR